MRGQEAGGKKKDGERKKTKPYTTIPSRGFALGKLPLDRPHQGAAMLHGRSEFFLSNKASLLAQANINITIMFHVCHNLLGAIRLNRPSLL